QNEEENRDEADQDDNDGEADFSDKKAKRSYALGMDIGNSLKGMPLDVDVQQMSDGIRDVVEGHDTRLSQDELQAVMQDLASEMEAAHEDRLDEQASENLEKGQ